MRKITLSGAARGLGIALLLSVVPLGIAYRYFGLGATGGQPESAAVLAKQARQALEAVRERDLATTLRPARYDAILMPLDSMLRIARDSLQTPDYDPVEDYDKIRSYCEPVINIALEAHNQAQSETSFLRKDYRFMQQRGDACRYLATAMWNRLEMVHERIAAGTDFRPTLAEAEKLYAVLNAGIEADPENAQLRYLRGVLGKASGAFAAARDDLRRALELDAGNSSAWNALGLVQINLRDFDEAARAFETAAEKSSEQAERAGVPPGAEYVTALFNLARFHEALMQYYQSAERMVPSPENKEVLGRHRDSAVDALNKIAAAVPAGSPERQQAQELLGRMAGETRLNPP